jgi:hypothetical protein
VGRDHRFLGEDHARPGAQVTVQYGEPVRIVKWKARHRALPRGERERFRDRFRVRLDVPSREPDQLGAAGAAGGGEQDRQIRVHGGATEIPRVPPEVDVPVGCVRPIERSRCCIVQPDDEFWAVDLDELLEVPGKGPGVEEDHRHSRPHASEVTDHRASDISREQEGQSTGGSGHSRREGIRSRPQLGMAPPAPAGRVEQSWTRRIDER